MKNKYQVMTQTCRISITTQDSYLYFQAVKNGDDYLSTIKSLVLGEDTNL